MREKIKEILEQIETVIVGKNDVMERILMAILAGGHVLMEDVPGHVGFELRILTLDLVAHCIRCDDANGSSG